MLICAGGSGDFFGGWASPCCASAKLSCAFPVALPSPVAAANGWYDCACDLQHEEVRLGVDGEAALAVGAAGQLAGRCPAGAGRNWLSTAVLTLPQALGTDLNSPCCSEVTYRAGLGCVVRDDRGDPGGDDAGHDRDAAPAVHAAARLAQPGRGCAAAAPAGPRPPSAGARTGPGRRIPASPAGRRSSSSSSAATRPVAVACPSAGRGIAVGPAQGGRSLSVSGPGPKGSSCCQPARPGRCRCRSARPRLAGSAGPGRWSPPVARGASSAGPGREGPLVAYRLSSP